MTATGGSAPAAGLDVVTFGEVMAMFVAGEPGPLERVKGFTLALAGAESNVAKRRASRRPAGLPTPRRARR